MAASILGFMLPEDSLLGLVETLLTHLVGLIIQGTVVSAEHVSKTVEPLNLKEFVRELPMPVIVGGCASYHTGLHLMRTGAAGVLVGVGPGAACTTRGSTTSAVSPRRSG